MATLEELKRDLARMRAEEEVRADINKRELERRQVQGELNKRKFARTKKAGRVVGSAVGSGIRGIGGFIERATRPKQSVRRITPVKRRTTVRRMTPIKRRRSAPSRRRRAAPIRRRTVRRAPTRRVARTRTTSAPKTQEFGVSDMFS